MGTTTIVLKKSANRFAWSNRNVGKIVLATKGKYDERDANSREVYHVKFSANTHLEGITEELVSGYVELCDADDFN